MVSAETQIGWQDYLAIILRRRWFFGVPCAGIVGISMIAGLFMPRIYRAETTILVQEANIMNPLIQGLAVSTPVSARLGTLREEILSWSSLSRLVNDLKLAQGVKSPLAFEQIVKKLQKEIQVRMQGRELILIAYEHPDPKLAQKLVNSISTIFLERNMTAQTAEAQTAIGFLNREMGGYKKELEGSEKQLREFQELYSAELPVAVELNDQIIAQETRLAELLVENTEIHPAVVEVKRRVQELKARRNAEIKRFVATSIARGQDPAIYENLLKVLEQPGQTVAGLDPKKVEIAQEAYAAWVKRLDNPVTAGPGGQPIQVVAAAPSEGAPVQMIGLGPTSVSLVPWHQQELSRLSRDYDVNTSTYQHLQERLERAKITQRLGESDDGLKFKILEPARLPLKPVKPNLWKIGFFALLLGVFVGMATVFVAEYLDQSFQSAEDLQLALALPVLGSISTIMTAQDLEKQRERLRHWMSVKNQLGFVGKRILQPAIRWVGGRCDQLLVRWKV